LKFLLYSLIGGFATCVHYVVLIALVEGFSVHPAVAAASGATCGALVAYTGNRRFTFSNRSSHIRTFPRFVFIAILGALLNGGVVWVGVSLMGWHYLLAQLVATLLVLLITYRLNRSWTFA
jgi:putative flippase GtrA